MSTRYRAKNCRIDGCLGKGNYDHRLNRRYFSKGLCYNHYSREYKVKKNIINTLSRHKSDYFNSRADIYLEGITNYTNRVCGICNLLIEGKYEIDHIIPLSRNGTHSYDNLQLTHPMCNRVKHSKLQSEMSIEIAMLQAYIGG